MPRFESVQWFPKPVDEVFDFFVQTANLVRISPPDLNLRLAAGPERVVLGSTIKLEGRRWGIAQRMRNEIVAYEPNVRFVDEQREGVFKSWRHAHEFAAADGGTQVTDRIDYEPPGGMLGLVVTAGMMERELRSMFEHRKKVLAELLGKR